LKLILCFILLSFSQLLFSQNLINNGSFEQLDDYNIPVEWKIISPTVDVLESGSRVFEKNLSEEFDKRYADYLPKNGSDGENYICLFKLGIGTEAIGIPLNKNLTKGVSYVISMDVHLKWELCSAMNFLKHATNNNV